MKLNYKDYLGIPFKHLGRDRNGVDCYGLLKLYFKEQLNIDIVDWWYEPDWSKKGCNYFISNYSKMAVKINGNPKIHDVVLFFTDITSKVANHVGIFVERPDTVIQAFKTGVNVSYLSSPVLRRRIEGIYRLKCLN